MPSCHGGERERDREEEEEEGSGKRWKERKGEKNARGGLGPKQQP